MRLVRSGEQSSHFHTFYGFVFWPDLKAVSHLAFDAQLFGKYDGHRSPSKQRNPVEQRGWYCGGIICRQNKMVEYQRQSKVEDKPWSSNEFKEVIDAIKLGFSLITDGMKFDTYSAEQAIIQQKAIIQPRLGSIVPSH